MNPGYGRGMFSAPQMTFYSHDLARMVAPHDWLDALRVAWVADPDGNPVQLVQHRA